MTIKRFRECKDFRRGVYSGLVECLVTTAMWAPLICLIVGVLCGKIVITLVSQ